MINMAQKHLHELLKEEQEPFLLKNYIADKRCQLKRPSPKTHLQVKKRRPVSSQVAFFPGNLCKNACLFSLQDSPDLRKSPLFEFSSPAAKSPCKSPNAIFLQIPNRTAAMLAEAAIRIQKQSASSKPKTQNKNHSFGLLGSFLKRLKNRNRTRKREIEGDGVNVSVKEILRWDSSVGLRKISHEEKVGSCLAVEDKSPSEISTCNGRPSSAVWSETNEDMSLDLDTASSSSQSEDSEENEFVTQQGVDADCVCSCEKININSFCESPFRFVLQTSPSPSGPQTPEFSSPATSPSRNKQEEEGLMKLFQVEEEEEEDKEQCSPVSVLDPPFQDDDEGREDDATGDDDDEDGFDLGCSYVVVQRTKHQLLQKLRRFEKLAGLDPIELEKRMLEQQREEEDDEYNNMDDLEGESEECENDESRTSDSSREENVDGLVREVLCKSIFHCSKRIQQDVKRLVSDLIVEEQREEGDAFDNIEEVARRVCKRFESWKEVESNTIDMMVEQDFRKELDGWKKNQDQVGETAMEIELAIFGLLVEEMAMELA